MRYLFCTFVLLTLSVNTAFGHYILQNGKITAVTNGNSTAPQQEEFFIKVDTDHNGCIAGTWIKFDKSDFGQNDDGYKYAYSMALSAIASGNSNVTVFNGVNTDCSRATWILVE